MRGQVRLAQGDKSVVVDAYDVFVSIDLGRDVAYIASCQRGIAMGRDHPLWRWVSLGNRRTNAGRPCGHRKGV